jgi:hypothetical protein
VIAEAGENLKKIGEPVTSHKGLGLTKPPNHRIPVSQLQREADVKLRVAKIGCIRGLYSIIWWLLPTAKQG